MTNKNLFASWQTTPCYCSIFGFSQVALSHFCKAVFCWKHYKNCIFSRRQLLGITDSKVPFEAPSHNGAFATNSAIWGFSHVPAETHIFIVFCHLEWPQRKDHFQKTNSCNENAPFLYRPNTNSVCLFSKNDIFTKKDHFLHNHPKTLFSVFLLEFTFSFFSYLLFYFFQHKKDKNKKCTFFPKTLFDTLTNCQKIFSHPCTLFVIFKIPKNTLKLGKTSKTNLGPSFDATLDQVWTQKTKSWFKFWLSSTYTYAGELVLAPLFGLTKSQERYHKKKKKTFFQQPEANQEFETDPPDS